MNIHWKSVDQHFTVVLFVFQFHPVFDFGKFIKFGLQALSGVKGLVVVILTSKNLLLLTI